MRCKICGKSEKEAEICDGIYEGMVSPICTICAEEENIPLIRKPSENQITTAETSQTVRERLERMSSPTRTLSENQKTANKNLAKIKFPQEKQHSELLVDNYYWAIKMARRRKKLTFNEISLSTSIPEEVLENIERGQIPKNIEETMRKLELCLGIKLLKSQELSPRFVLPERDKQERILAETEQKIHSIERGETQEEDQDKIEKLKKIEKGQIDFSKRKELQDVTLADLQEMKKRKDVKEQFEQEKSSHEDFFGDDLEIEED